MRHRDLSGFLCLFNPGSSSCSADWSLLQQACPWGVPAVVPGGMGAAPCWCALGYQCSAHSFHACLAGLLSECPHEGQEWSAIKQGTVTSTAKCWGQQLCTPFSSCGQTG